MDHARGEYTIHADPDDWVDPTMLEELYRKAKEEDADMVICDFYEERKNKTIYVRQQPSSLDHETVLCELFQQLHGSCCNKLVKRACYRDFGVRFPLELSFCEDLFVNACLLSHNVKVACLAKAFYHYDQYSNTDSLIHRSNKIILNQIIKFRELLSRTLSHGIFDKIYPYILYNQALIILGGDKNSLNAFCEEFKDLKPLIIRTDVSKKWKIIVWTAFNLSPYLANYLYKIGLRILH